MEENKRKGQKKSVLNGSIVLSFAVAIFAVFSLAMAGISMNQNTGVSYAAVVDPSINVVFGDQILARAQGEGGVYYSYTFHPYYKSDSTGKIINNQLFCIERGLDVSQETYTNTSSPRSALTNLNDDYGLLYLLALGQSSTQRKAISDNDAISTYVVQSAIWKYLAEKYTNVNEFKLRKVTDDFNAIDDKLVMESDSVIIRIGSGNDVVYTGLGTKVKDLVNRAKNATVPRVSVAAVSDEVSKTEDGNYYQSSLISVTGSPSDTFDSYSVALSDGNAFIVNENGEKICSYGWDGGSCDDTARIPAGKNFYVRIPADKVTSEVKQVSIRVTGAFNNSDLVYYKTGDDSLQRMATAVPGYYQGQTSVEFVTSPDTGMNTAQTIYFIGLIVLLCGVGIVYANAKPVQVKQ